MEVRKIYKNNVNTSFPIWLDDIQCNGSEKHIADCAHNNWGIHNCERGENVAISCPGMGFCTLLMQQNGIRTY